MASSPFQNRPGLVGGFSITMEEFKVFHSIDRQLYTRLVTDLGRDPSESMQVMALLLWLERSTRDMHLVGRLLRLHEAVLSYVIEEAATILKVVENDDFPYVHEDVNSSEIPLLQTLMAKNDDVTLRFFHNHRLGVIRGVTHLMNEICVKAFNDIMQRVMENRHSLFQVSPNSSGMLGNVPFRPPSGFNSNVPRVRLYAPGSSSGTPIPYDESIDPRVYIEATAVAPPYDLQVQRDILNNQMGELLDEIFTTTIGGDNQRQIGSEVPPDDRTIFLTFSKGYPISENEVREFFTRRNGDVIEAIYMQEVPPEDQILYARMVIKSPALIDVILGGVDVKAKFAINGKHVWGRKYVKKSSGAAGASSSSSPSGGGQ
uniref:Uncharacterized protein n=1 Tax=Kalanchoe fedtschenkoi TaxID=63787 RepID=A0A7N0UC32_KALFE